MKHDFLGELMGRKSLPEHLDFPLRRRKSGLLLGHAFIDLVPTVANVVTSSGAISKGEFNGSATMTEGMVVYLTASNLWAKAGCTSATLAGGIAPFRVGILLAAVLNGQPAIVQETGVINLGCTLTVGTLYVISATAGKICPFADLATTNKINILGIATTAALLDMTYKGAYPAGYTGVAVP